MLSCQHSRNAVFADGIKEVLLFRVRAEAFVQGKLQVPHTDAAFLDSDAFANNVRDGPEPCIDADAAHVFALRFEGFCLVLAFRLYGGDFKPERK